MLRKGNPRPAPGPDLWEKWCIRSLSDTSLSLVLDLVNYEISASHFPDCVKPVIMSTIFKRGPRTDLANYRGITCSNLCRAVAKAVAAANGNVHGARRDPLADESLIPMWKERGARVALIIASQMIDMKASGLL